MAITGAVPRDGNIYVYGSDGSITATIPFGSDEDDGLVAVTPTTVTVRRAGLLLVYGEDGKLVTRSTGR